MKYEVVRTETADAQIRKIVLYIAENFGNKVALEKLEELEQNILDLAVHPLKGGETHYLVLEKNLVFYKINEENKRVIIYAVVDQRQDYLNIIRGL